VKTTFKTFLLFATTTMAVAWFLGAIRFAFPQAEKIFQIVLFPFGWLYIVAENYVINDGRQGWLDDEFGQGMLFLLLVLLQAWFYFLIVWLARKLK